MTAREGQTTNELLNHRQLTRERCGSMLDFTWKLFSQTGNIDTYLLFKELERETQEQGNNETYYLAERDYHVL